jgi:hypothetical protein
MERAPWIPLVIPCPQAFIGSGYVLPCLLAIATPHLVEMFGHKTKVIRLKSIDPPRVTQVSGHDLHKHDFLSLPHLEDPHLRWIVETITRFLSESVLHGGWFNEGLHIAKQHGYDPGLREYWSLHVTITRSFLMISTDSLVDQPLYRSDRIEWSPSLRVPDLPEDPAPLQIVIPIDCPNISRHEQAQRWSLIEEDLRFLSIARYWGDPLDPVWATVQTTTPS